jgi:peroxiredoxin
MAEALKLTPQTFTRDEHACRTARREPTESSTLEGIPGGPSGFQVVPDIGIQEKELPMPIPRPTPGQPAPPLDVALVGGGRWSLADQHPERFSLVVSYRGHHCPVCRGYLKQLNGLLDQFAEVGVTSVVAVSGDDEEHATASRDEWGLGRMNVGYGQDVASMRDWGLYVSKGIKEDEPDLFGEPGLFVIRADGSLYAAVLNTIPFGRPHIDEIVGSIAYVNDHDYPARGEA